MAKISMPARGAARDAGAGLALFLAAACCSCVSPAPTPKYTDVPQPLQGQSRGSVLVGPFLDQRPHATEMGPRYFGTVRDNLGVPRERMYYEAPVSDVVAEVAQNVLRSQGYQAERAGSSLHITSDGSSWFIANASAHDVKGLVLTGRITEFDCATFQSINPIGTRRVVIGLDVYALDPGSGKTIWHERIDGSDADRGNWGPSDNDKAFGPWLKRLTEDRLSAVLSGVSLKDLPTTTLAGSAQQPAGRNESVEHRLTELKDLYDKGLIDTKEYQAKKREILNGL